MRPYTRATWLFLLHTAIFNFGLLGIPDVVTNFYLVSLGLTPDQIGLLLSMSRIGGLLTGLPVGWYASRLGEIRILIAGAVGSALALGLMLLFPSIIVIAVSRFLMGAFYGAGQIATAPLMVRLVDKTEATQFFAVVNIVGMGASAFGTLVGGMLPALLVGAAVGSAESETTQAYGLSLFVCLVFTLLSVLPLLFIRAPQPAGALPLQPRSQGSVRSTPWRKLLIFSAPMLLFGFTGGLTFPFYNLFFRETFAVTDDVVGQVLSIGWLGMALIPMLNPFWERRFGRAMTLGVLMTVAGLALFGLGRAPTLLVGIPFFVLGVGLRNCMQPLYQPLLLDALPPSQHNLASSVSLVVWNVGWFVATAISGVWQNSLGFAFIFTVVSVGVIFNGWLTYAIFRRAPVYQSTALAVEARGIEP
jgi:MFS family permease